MGRSCGRDGEVLGSADQKSGWRRDECEKYGAEGGLTCDSLFLSFLLGF
jgi:hypothetical protein